MKRRELREHIFRLLFRVEFNDAADMPEQVALYMEDLPMAGEQDRRYIEKKYELVMEHLKKIDEVAYVRFASVYKEFDSAESFRDELAKLGE